MEELEQKAVKLGEVLRDLRSVLVAYSGGTDSAFLAWAAHQALGERMLAVIADSPSLPRAELAAALAFTAEHGIPTRTLHTEELSRPEYVRNDARRCFHCKDELFTAMEGERARLGFAHLAFGMNLDDRGEFRPGQQAASLHGAVAPLVSAALSKVEIRSLARVRGLPLWDKPASACLSSRIEYGRPVTPEALLAVELAEEALHRMGFPQVRVRHHGDVARIEIDCRDLPRALNLGTLAAMTSAVREAGFPFVALDTEGYRSGSMNDVLPLSSILPATR